MRERSGRCIVFFAIPFLISFFLFFFFFFFLERVLYQDLKDVAQKRDNSSDENEQASEGAVLVGHH